MWTDCPGHGQRKQQGQSGAREVVAAVTPQQITGDRVGTSLGSHLGADATQGEPQGGANTLSRWGSY